MKRCSLIITWFLLCNIVALYAQPLSVASVDSPVLCHGDSSGRIDISVSGGTPPYSFLWTGPGGFASTEEDLDSLFAGIYEVRIIDAADDTIFGKDTVRGPDSPLCANMTVFNINCPDSLCSIDLVVSGGTPPYTFYWSNGDTTEDPDSLPTGEYRVIVTDSNGCVALMADAGRDTIICRGSSLQIGGMPAALGGVQPWQYHWSGDTTISDTSAANPLVTPDDSTTYVLTVTDRNGKTSVDSVVVKVTGFDTLFVSDFTNKTLTAANPDDSLLYLYPDPDGAFHIRLKISPLPSGATERGLLLWRIDDSTATPSNGDFSDSVDVVLNPHLDNPDTSFTVLAGCDTNANGILDSGEVQRQMQIKKQPLVFSIDSLFQFSYLSPFVEPYAPVVEVNFSYYNPPDSPTKYLNLMVMNPDSNLEILGIANLALPGFHTPRPVAIELSVIDIGFAAGDTIDSIEFYAIILDTIYDTLPVCLPLPYHIYPVTLREISFGGSEPELDTTTSPPSFYTPPSFQNGNYPFVQYAPGQVYAPPSPCYFTNSFPLDENKKVIRGCAIPNIELNSTLYNPVDVPGYAGDVNSCVPAACANSLQWLEQEHSAVNTGLSHRDKLVELSAYMLRQNNAPTHFGPQLRGKLGIIDNHQLPLSVSFQSNILLPAFYPSPVPNTNHFASNQSNFLNNSPYHMGRISWDWIFDGMESGADMEVSFTFYKARVRTSDGVLIGVAPVGGHCVVLTGIAQTDHKRYMWYKDDIQQEKNGGTGERVTEILMDCNGGIYLASQIKVLQRTSTYVDIQYGLIDMMAAENYDALIAFGPKGDTMLGPSQVQGSDRVGASVDVYKNYAIAGAPLTDNKKGVAYIFFKDNGKWKHQAMLKDNDVKAGDKFGYAVHITEDYAIVGAPEDRNNGVASGAAYVFKRNGETWERVTKLVPNNPPNGGDYFGYTVAIAGDYAVVGALGDDDKGAQSGSIYIYHRNGGNWDLLVKKTASDGAANDYFGFDVDMTEDDIIASAPRKKIGNNLRAGSAYIFHRTGNVWAEQQKLVADDPHMDDIFGYSVGIYEDEACIGAVGHDGVVNNGGAVYAFKKNGGAWAQQSRFTSADVTPNDEFGSDVKCISELAIVGVYLDEPNGLRSGSSYLFARTGNNWAQNHKLLAPHPFYLDEYGLSVGVTVGTAIVGASGDDTKGGNAGAVYFYGLNQAIPMLIPNNNFQKFTTGLDGSMAEVLPEASEIGAEDEIDTANRPSAVTDLLIYPNPTRGEITIAWPASAGTGTIDLMDGSGKLVSRVKSEGNIQVSGLRMGVYTLRMQFGGEVHYRRLVVVK